MLQNPDRPPASPQLAMRVAVLGGVAFAVFAVIFLRLWSLQVLHGDEYVAQASGNRVRSLPIEAPRGEIVDRAGRVLADDRRAVAVVVSPTTLPADGEPRRALLRRLSGVLRVPTRPRRCRFGPEDRPTYLTLMPLECRVRQSIGALPYADVVVEPDASPAVFAHLADRAQEFPGVALRDRFVRDYPHGALAAHALGYVGQANEADLEDPSLGQVRGGENVGKQGLERQYDPALRGTPGASRVQVNADGEQVRDLDDVAPRKGHTLQVSLDLGLQRAGEAALREGISLAHAHGNAANAAAFVALDLRDGAVLGMGSVPSFDPNEFAGGISTARYAELTSEAANTPMFDRAAQANFAIGSTFKPITLVAALAAGATSLGDTWHDDGTWEIGDQVRYNAGRVSFGSVGLVEALAVSVDTFFYDLGRRLDRPVDTHPDGGPLQAWARRFGFGSPTGIDLPVDGAGTVPDQRWVEDLQDEERRCRRERRLATCGKALLEDTWTVGDNVSLAIGQGDFLATPLQLAVAYAALGNGGTVVRPHLATALLDREGRVVERYRPRPARRLEIPGLETIQQGLLDATTAADGTATDVFAGFGKPVHGKTGTAQRDGEPDQSWFAAWVEDPERPIAVAVLVEDGGFGAQAAAPAARQILSHWFYGRAGRAVAGASRG